MDWTTPLAPFVTSLEGAVLDSLHRIRGVQTASEVHRRARGAGSLSGVRFALDRLAEQGLVTSQKVGNVVAYSLNREHLAYPALEAALVAYTPYKLLRTRIRDLVLERFADMTPPSVALFGSVRRQEATTDSDVDVLVVLPEDSERAGLVAHELIPLLYDQIGRWTGNEAQVVASTVQSLLDARDAGEPFIRSLQDEADTVVGPDVRGMLAVEVHL